MNNQSNLSRKVIVALCTAMTSFYCMPVVSAEIQWVKVMANDNIAVYIAKGSAHVDGGNTVAEFLYDYVKPDLDGGEAAWSHQQQF